MKRKEAKRGTNLHRTRLRNCILSFAQTLFDLLNKRYNIAILYFQMKMIEHLAVSMEMLSPHIVLGDSQIS